MVDKILDKETCKGDRILAVYHISHYIFYEYVPVNIHRMFQNIHVYILVLLHTRLYNISL